VRAARPIKPRQAVALPRPKRSSPIPVLRPAARRSWFSIASTSRAFKAGVVVVASMSLKRAALQPERRKLGSSYHEARDCPTGDYPNQDNDHAEDERVRHHVPSAGMPESAQQVAPARAARRIRVPLPRRSLIRSAEPRPEPLPPPKLDPPAARPEPLPPPKPWVNSTIGQRKRGRR